jgi:ubiquitin C-terminal hydrolase
MFIFNAVKNFFYDGRQSESTHIINDDSIRFVYYKIEYCFSFSIMPRIKILCNYNQQSKISCIERCYPLRLDKQQISIGLSNKTIYGFPNTGNSCYLNSALQIMIHQPFKILDKLILETASIEENGICDIVKKILFYALNFKREVYLINDDSIIKNMLVELKNNLFLPTELCNDSQQDANEFYLRLISKFLLSSSNCLGFPTKTSGSFNCKKWNLKKEVS